MRYARLLLLAPAVLPIGCAATIAESGTDVGRLHTRADVRREFGPPAVTGATDGRPFDEFRTRRKIAEPMRSVAARLAAGMTYGLTEVAFVPGLLVQAGARTVVGQDLRFVYDPAGNVTEVLLNGDPAGQMPRTTSDSGEPAATPPAEQP